VSVFIITKERDLKMLIQTRKIPRSSNEIRLRDGASSFFSFSVFLNADFLLHLNLAPSEDVI
jgi:hypothetical protein